MSNTVMSFSSARHSALNVPVQPDFHAFTGAACAFLCNCSIWFFCLLYSYAPPLAGYLSQCSAVHHARYGHVPADAVHPLSYSCLLSARLYILRPSPVTGLAFQISV